MKWRLLACGLVLLLGSATALALTPAPPPHNHKIYSEFRHFYAAVSARTKTTAVKEVRKGWIDPVRWRIPRYFEWAAVADDGSLVLVSDGMVPRPFSRKQVIIRVYHRYGTESQITLGSAVQDLSRLGDAMGLGTWGSVESIDGEWLRLRTCEDRTLYVHARTGETRMHLPAVPAPR